MSETPRICEAHFGLEKLECPHGCGALCINENPRKVNAALAASEARESKMFALRIAAELRADTAEARCAELVRDAERHRKARTLFSIEDVERAVFEQSPFICEEENVKYDAAIDAAIDTAKEGKT